MTQSNMEDDEAAVCTPQESLADTYRDMAALASAAGMPEHTWILADRAYELAAGHGTEARAAANKAIAASLSNGPFARWVKAEIARQKEGKTRE